MCILSICPIHTSTFCLTSVIGLMCHGDGDIEASGRHWPLHILWGRHCFIIFIKIIWVMSWKKNNRNCLDHHPHCQCRRLILFSLSGAECQDTKCLPCKQAAHRSDRKTKRGRPCANPLATVWKIRNVRGPVSIHHYAYLLLLYLFIYCSVNWGCKQ